MKIVLVFIAVLLFGSTIAQNPYIRDESATDASFLTFKKQLQKAVEGHDVALLLPLLADSVRESHNGICQYCPKQLFVATVCVPNETRPNDAYFWEQAALLLNYGFVKGNPDQPNAIVEYVNAKEFFTAPSYAEVEVYDSVLVLAGDVAVYSAPFADSAVIAHISYGKLPTHSTELHTPSPYDHYVFNQDENTGWICVGLADGRTGYIKEAQTSATVFKEMTVAKIKGQWKIISFYHPPGC